MACFQAQSEWNGPVFPQACVVVRSFGMTKPRSLRLGLQENRLRLGGVNRSVFP